MFSTMYTVGEQNSGTINWNHFSSLKWCYISELTASINYISFVAKFLMSRLLLDGSVGTIYIDLDDMKLIRIALGGDYEPHLRNQVWYGKSKSVHDKLP